MPPNVLSWIGLECPGVLSVEVYEESSSSEAHRKAAHHSTPAILLSDL